jgi:hypothetical protein
MTPPPLQPATDPGNSRRHAPVPLTRVSDSCCCWFWPAAGFGLQQVWAAAMRVVAVLAGHLLLLQGLGLGLQLNAPPRSSRRGRDAQPRLGPWHGGACWARGRPRPRRARACGSHAFPVGSVMRWDAPRESNIIIWSGSLPEGWLPWPLPTLSPTVCPVEDESLEPPQPPVDFQDSCIV